MTANISSLQYDWCPCVEERLYPQETCWREAGEQDVSQHRVALSSTPKPASKRRKVSRMDRITPIDVDQHVPVCEVNTWINNRTFTLLHEDKDVLLHPAAWLTSSIIAAAQSMLKKQHRSMGGLQDPCLSQSMGFRKVSGDFVQVVHTDLGIG